MGDKVGFSYFTKIHKPCAFKNPDFSESPNNKKPCDVKNEAGPDSQQSGTKVL